MTATVSYTPETPRAGEEIVFTIRVADPDRRLIIGWPDGCTASPHWGDLSQAGSCSALCDASQRYGPWSPPPPEPGERVFEYRHRYEGPGTYSAKFFFRSYELCEEDHPYRNEITVAAPLLTVEGPPAATTTTAAPA
jgi:hypothetical protein